jgi:hypothetical protein
LKNKPRRKNPSVEKGIFRDCRFWAVSQMDLTGVESSKKDDMEGAEMKGELFTFLCGTAMK